MAGTIQTARVAFVQTNATVQTSRVALLPTPPAAFTVQTSRMELIFLEQPSQFFAIGGTWVGVKGVYKPVAGTWT